jgi:hypothetical protein
VKREARRRDGDEADRGVAVDQNETEWRGSGGGGGSSTSGHEQRAHGVAKAIDRDASFREQLAARQRPALELKVCGARQERPRRSVENCAAALAREAPAPH